MEINKPFGWVRHFYLTSQSQRKRMTFSRSQKTAGCALRFACLFHPSSLYSTHQDIFDNNIIVVLSHFIFRAAMTKRKTEDHAVYVPATEAQAVGDDGFAEQPARKRSKITETAITPPARAPRRSSSIVTTFNLCDRYPLVSQDSLSKLVYHHSTSQSSLSDSRSASCDRAAASVESDCREQPDDSFMEEQQEMRDLTETMRDMVSF